MMITRMLMAACIVLALAQAGERRCLDEQGRPITTDTGEPLLCPGSQS